MSESKDALEEAFPKLKDSYYEIHSPISRAYNCIAFAVGDTERFWWPKEEFYWPEQVDLEPTLEAFVEAFRTVGFEVSPDEESTNTDDEIALYAKGDDPKHASKKLEGGLWASKLGTSVDIKHEYKALEGNEYGEVVLKMERDT